MSRGIWWSMGARTRRSFTFFWTALFVLSLMLQYASFAAAPPALAAASLTAGTVEGFEIDGDLDCQNATDNPGSIPDGNPAGEDDLVNGSFTDGDDWLDAAGCNGVVQPATPPSSAILLDLINDTGDDVFIGGAKEDDTRTWGYTTQKPTPKDDIRHAMAYAKFVGSSAFFYAGATRIVNNGDTHVDFELNRKPFKTYSDGVSKPDREVGDVLVSLEFSNGGSVPIVTVYKVTAVQEFPTGELATFTADVATAAAVHAATNFVELPDQGLGYGIPEFEFAETSIDLAALGIETSCPGLSNGHIRTRAGGDVASSQLKDNLPPFPIDLNNCGKVTVIKNAIPDDAQDFSFTSGLGNFSLDDDANATLSDTKVFSDVQNGAYSITEEAVDGWRLTGITCDDNNGSINLAGRTANINVGPNEEITCTFTNTKDGRIVTVKETDPDGAPDSFDFDPSWGPNFSLTDGQSNNSGFLQPGSGYSVVENTPAGWDLSSVSCSDGSPNTNINLAAGEVVTCTFTNRKEGKIIVVKETTPDGSAQSFAFTASYDADGFSLSDGQSNDSGLLDPGTYSVAETVPAGWELTSATCSDGSNPASISLGAGETVTCTFNNRQQGKIIVTKQTNPDGSSQSFHFDADYDADGFDLTDGQSNDSGFLSPGTYSVSEDVPAGWDLTNATCSDGSAPGAIALAAGETVTCTFTNTQRGQIVVVKQTDPDGDPTLFSFTASYDGDGFSLSDGQSNNSGLLVPGTYVVAEVVPAGWDLTGATCDDGSDPASIALAAGETVTCTFTNQKDARIVVVKQTLPDGSTQSFEFDPSWGPNFSLKDGQSHDSGDLDPGTYSVAENVPSGWDLTGATCSDQSDPDSIGLSAGETVTCTFTNTQRGTIIVEKQTSPDGAGGTFTFSGDAAGSIGDGGQIVVSNLVPGTYTSTEADPAPAFDLGAIVCDDGGSANASDGDVATRTATFELDPGETVTCVFTNSQRGTITIIKNAQPDSAQDFTYSATGSGLSSFSLDDDGDATLSNTKTFTNLVAGSYSVTEAGVAGWDLTSLECNGTNGSTGVPAGATANITLTNGGSVTCVYVNSLPSVSIVKTAGDAEDGDELVVEAGTDVTFSYLVTNTGPVTLVDISVVDDNGTPGDASDDVAADCPKSTLAAGESMTCTATITIEETRTNVAVASGESEQGTEVDDEDDAVVRVPGTDLSKDNDDEDGIVGHGQVVGYTINVTVFEGPVTNAVVTDELPVGQTYVAGSQTSSPVAESFAVSADGRTLTWTWDELDEDAVIEYDVTIDADAPTGPQTNVAELCVSELETCQPDDSTVTVPELTIDKSFTGNTGGTGPGGIQEAKIGDTLTYTLAYDLTNGPVTNGVITDVIPVGLQYLDGSATSNAEFTFQSYDAATRTLTWTANEVTADGSVTYQVKVLVGADELPQPLVNVAAIDSDETDKDDDEDDVFVEPPPQIVTATPRITLPPTSTTDGADHGAANPGQTLMLVLLALAGLVLAVGFATPAPERARRRGRRR